MRFCADENVAPLLSALIKESLLGKAHTLETVDDHQARGVDDDIWVRKFANVGGEAIIGSDGKMLTRPMKSSQSLRRGSDWRSCHLSGPTRS